VDVDLALLKNIRVPQISETFGLQLRFEFFNILNHANFQAPVDNLQFNGILSPPSLNGIDAGSAGTITTTNTPSRQIQLRAKIIW
jgi:hypothetical protein